MLQEVMLLRESGRVSNYIDNHVKLVDSGNRDEVLELFDNMYRFFPHWVISTCPKMHPDLQYVSQNCATVFGYSREFLLRNSGLENYMSMIHEDDQQDLYECIVRIHDFLEDISPEEHHRHRVVVHYRFRHADGNYIYLHDEKASVQIKGGTVYYVLFKDITEERAFGGVKMELFRQEETIIKVKEYKPSAERNPLTPREQDLVTLIRQGLSTKEIAWQLKISHNTVRNIKSKLFEKYNVNNSIELLNLTE